MLFFCVRMELISIKFRKLCIQFLIIYFCCDLNYRECIAAYFFRLRISYFYFFSTCF